MNDAADLLRFFPSFMTRSVSAAASPAVNNHRKFFFPSKRNLTAEPVFLLLVILLNPSNSQGQSSPTATAFSMRQSSRIRAITSSFQIAHLIRVKAERAAVDERFSIKFFVFSVIPDLQRH